MQCSVILQQRIENAQQRTSLRATGGFISESWDWQRWLRLVSSPRQFPHGVLLPFLMSSLPWTGVPLRADCYSMYYSEEQGAHIKLSRVSPFFCPHLTCYQSCDLWVGPWSNNVAFFSTNFQDISPPGWMRGSVWPNAREGFDETPIGPLGSKRQLMGGWNAIIAIHQPLQN